MQACNRQSAYCVPLYDTLGSDAVRYIINHAEVTLVFADSLKMPALIQPLAETKGQVSAVVYWGECDTLAKVVSNRLNTGQGSGLHLCHSSIGVLCVPVRHARSCKGCVPLTESKEASIDVLIMTAPLLLS